MTVESSRFEALGGEPKLRMIIDDFVERIFADIMIGFFFAKADKDRVKEKEYEHAAEWLGAPVPYTGRPLREAHQKHPIMGGQFMRRRKLLENTLRDHAVDEELIAAWLAHQDGLRDQVTRDAQAECIDPRARTSAVDNEDEDEGSR